VQLPCGENAQERVDAPEEPDAVLVNGREAKVGVSAAPSPPGRELNGPGFEEDKLRYGIYAEAGGIRALTDEDLIPGEIGDRQEDLELERQGARRAGKRAIRSQRFFERFSVGRFEVELDSDIVNGRAR
jgi:hypothetical protein